MIRVTIEMVPGGNEHAKFTMHVIEIWNDLVKTRETDGEHGSYRYRISRKIKGPNPAWQREGHVATFPRKSKNAVHLLKAVLDEAYR